MVLTHFFLLQRQDFLSETLQTPNLDPLTCRYAGMVALLDTVRTPEDYEYLRYQIITELAESLDAPFETPADLPIHLYVEGETMTHNDLDVGKSFKQWAVIQQERAKDDPRHLWYADFAQAEAEEHDNVVRFYASADIGDVYVAISAMPENAPSNADLLAQNFKPDTRRSFIRTYTKTAAGLEERTASVDSSEMKLWNKVMDTHAFSAQMLLKKGYIYSGMTASEIITDIRNRYDALLYKKTGLVHSNGQTVTNRLESMRFVMEQSVLVDGLINQLKAGVLKQYNPVVKNQYINDRFYEAKSTLVKLYEDRKKGHRGTLVSGSDVASIMANDGAVAAAQGKVYSGCSGANVMSSQNSDLANNGTSHFDTFSMPKIQLNTEKVIMRKTECPYCCQKVVAPYDTESNQFLCCTNRKCNAYIPYMANFNVSKNPSRSESHTGDDHTDHKHMLDAENTMHEREVIKWRLRELQYRIWDLQHQLFCTTDVAEKGVIVGGILSNYAMFQTLLRGNNIISNEDNLENGLAVAA